MREVKSICDKLISTQSTLEKREILESAGDKFKYVLRFLLDDNITTGISLKKIHKNLSIEAPKITNFIDLVDYLRENNTGSDVQIAAVQGFISSQDEDLREFLTVLVTKTLKLGVNKKIVNDVYGDNFIPHFDVMLGTPMADCKLKDGEYIYLSRKLNGFRAVFYDDKFYSRSGKIYQGLNHIKCDLEKIKRNIDEWVIDGELVYKNKENLSDSAAFQVGAGILNSDAKEKPEICFKIFDIISKGEFDSNNPTTLYSIRRLMVKSIPQSENVKTVEFLYEGTDHSQIDYWLDKCENELDWEGVMLNKDTPYERKRTKNLIKIKKFKECDILCIGIKEGTTGKYVGTLGSLNCIYKGNEISVSGGEMTKEQRDHYWCYPNGIIGKIITVRYKEETTNKKGGTSIQFPNWIATRLDKTEESYN